MPNIIVGADGMICAVKSRDEIIVYYDAQIEKRMQAMLKLQALGGDVTTVQNKIRQLNEEKKQRIIEGG